MTPQAPTYNTNTLTNCGFEAFVLFYLRQSADDVVKGKRRPDVGVHHKQYKHSASLCLQCFLTAINFH